MNRLDGRAPNELRPVSFEIGIAPHASGSVVVAMGNTRVICAVMIDEGVPLAKAEGRPHLSATGGLNNDLSRTGYGNGRTLTSQLSLSYPLYSGGSVKNRIRGAEERVIGGRANLRATEAMRRGIVE